TAALPTDKDCIGRITAAITAQKLSFEPGEAVLKPEAKPTIDKIAEIMKQCADYPMEVGGHTDSQGSEEMNLSLSEQRARAVIVALQSRRILTGNLTAKGYGETQPLMANDTEADREINRRIEFRLLNPSSGSEGATDASGLAVQTPDKTSPRPKDRPANLGKK
ncbi:MAG: OmpA family protein, partial [Rhodobacteraceae bacterium]|nr:OmpA family protein [Paracoccaceae bacterium]